MRLTAKLKRDMEKWSKEEYPREACGLIVNIKGKPHLVPCENKSKDDNQFVISPEEYAKVEDEHEIIGVFHSHVNESSRASEVDRVSCNASNLPWVILSIYENPENGKVEVHDFNVIEPDGFIPPLVGRSFHHGTLDCYGLIRDFYQRELGIGIPDFEREDGWWDKEDSGELYLENFEKAGFVKIGEGEELKFGDVILMQYRSDKTNHGGVYLGDQPLKSQPELHPLTGAMLHHAMPRLSERVLYAGYWKDITRMVVRHKDLL